MYGKKRRLDPDEGADAVAADQWSILRDCEVLNHRELLILSVRFRTRLLAAHCIELMFDYITSCC